MQMIWIRGGSFRMGSVRHYPEEAPVRRVEVDGFWIDETAVTNAQFSQFVESTGYVTISERGADAALYPGADSSLLGPASLVFRQPAGPVDLDNLYEWWTYVEGANWRHPEGPSSSIDARLDHPVVHLALADVEAFASFSGKALPTEAEWEFAARGGLDGCAFAWGDEFEPGGEILANTWQGDFPTENLVLDGYERTAPVRSFPPNGYGLYEVTGNVWEWTDDWYQPRHAGGAGSPASVNPKGGLPEASYDPAMPGLRIPRKVLKGGSFLCAPNYCRRCRPAARIAHHVDTSTCHIGFRLVVRPPAGTEAAG